MAPTYVPYSDDLEQVTDDEEMLAEQIVEQMMRTNLFRSGKIQHGIRDAHAKAHGYLTGELEVSEDLPSYLRQGLFADPGTFPVAVRLSSAPGAIHSDKIPVAQGMAIKVIGVAGARLLPGDTGRNQDFLLINVPVLPFGTIQNYRRQLELLEANVDAPAAIQSAVASTARLIEGALKAVGVQPGPTVVGLARTHRHVLGETYHSAAAVRFGDYVAKLSVAPASTNVVALAGRVVRPTSDNSLQGIVCDVLLQSGVEYDVRAQLCTDLEAMPVEDASLLWSDQLSPSQTIARLRFPRQHTCSDERALYFDDVLSFNPWHGIAAHRPLGSINRVRIKAYERSAAFRHEYNGVERAEPASLQDIPD